MHAILQSLKASLESPGWVSWILFQPWECALSMEGRDKCIVAVTSHWSTGEN